MRSYASFKGVFSSISPNRSESISSEERADKVPRSIFAFFVLDVLFFLTFDFCLLVILSPVFAFWSLIRRRESLN